MPDAPATAGRWTRLLDALPAHHLRELSIQASARARELGLAVVTAGGDVPIPITLSPEVVDSEALATRARDAARVLSAVVKAARVVLSPGVDSPRARMLFGHFGPLEQECLHQWRKAEDVTIARIDWFLDARGRHFALEVNATIPAMESYSDAAARSWIETMSRQAGLSPGKATELVERNGSNAEELRRTIVAHSS
jgi:hypothetical protein